MRILCVSAQKPDSTGSGVYLAETVKGFLNSGHDVAVIAGIDRDDQPVLPQGTQFYPVYFRTEELPFPVCGMSDEMPYEATRYRDLNRTMIEQFKAAFSKACSEAIANFQPELIVCHHLYLLTALIAQQFHSCPVVAISHSTDLRQMQTHDLERDFIIKGIQHLDRICALHESQAEDIEILYSIPASRISVVGTGFNDVIFRPEDPKKDSKAECEAPEGKASDAGTHPIRVAYAGKIWRKKGVGCLLRCLDLLPWESNEFSLRLAGGFAHQDEYDRMKELAARSRYDVSFLGRLSQEELASVYRSSDIFVLPSFFEGLPLVVIEALACSCVVVVTDLPGIQPWLEHEIPDAPVIYVKPPRMATVDEPAPGEESPFEKRLAQALIEAARMSKNSLPAEALQHLSWHAVADRIIAAGTQLPT